MDALELNKRLKSQVEAAHETAREVGNEGVEILYLGMALDAVKLRIGWLEKQAADAPKAAKAKEKSK